MKEGGIISDELARWGNELRFIGNMGAHPTDDVPTNEDAEDALDFLQAIVETLYVLRLKFQIMHDRRRKASESAQELEESPIDDDG